MSLRYICDFCERPLQIRNIEGMDAAEYYVTKEWNTKQLYPCLCKTCAEKLDATIKKVKDEAVLSNLIAVRNRKLNNERKLKLGTKG